MKIYDQVKYLLQTEEQTRNNDKVLYWRILQRKNLLRGGVLTQVDFMIAPSFETVRRCRQKLQEIERDLGATDSHVRRKRKQKQDTKGTFIYREQY